MPESIPSNHVIGDDDFNNLVGLLKILAHQLELSLVDAHKDYQQIMHFCLLAEENERHIEAGIDKAKVISALQYFDRKRQRIQNVSQSIESVAQNFEEESWAAIDVDLEEELAKTDSFYTECQVREMSDIANSSMSAVKKVETAKSTQKKHDDDMEMF